MKIKETYFTMSDGVRLYTRIILPEENKKFPIVFIRTPYDQVRNGEPYPEDEYKDEQFFIKNGYAIVLQHTRGKGDSEGVCMPYCERQDGLETLELIRKLPFYNGEIYLYGASYLSTVHLCYISTKPKDIKAAALDVQLDNMYLKTYRNGCCYRFANPNWWMSMVKRQYPDQNNISEALIRPYYKIAERVLGEDLPGYTKLLLNPEYNDFWKSQENDNAVNNISFPVLLSEGWYDFYINGMFTMWDRLPAETKEKSIFVAGPWGHATKVKDSEYPFENGNLPDDYVVKFFNSVRDNEKYEYLECGKVNYYSVGGNFWTTDDCQTKNMKLYFNDDNTLNEKSYKKGEKTYIYDPDKPLNFYKCENIFKAPDKNTSDGVLSFESEPFKKDTDFYGKINWNMKVKTDCEDTAFFMRVYFVEDGIAYNLTETITTLSHINKNYVSGEECVVNISTSPIGFTIKEGNSIRVDISSHSDMYAPHSNTKGHWAKVTETKIAKNTVICDENAWIELPVV